MRLIDMVKNKVVRFKFYKENELFYSTEDGFIFPVPISDIGNATFLAEDKAPLFMRYIRKEMAIQAEYEKLKNKGEA